MMCPTVLKTNICLDGLELTVYYTVSPIQSPSPCRFCGRSYPDVNVLERDVKIQEVLEGYSEIESSSPTFTHVKQVISRLCLHGKASCCNTICNKRDEHEMLGEDVVMESIFRGEYIPDGE